MSRRFYSFAILATLLGLTACEHPSNPDPVTIEESYVHERPAWSPNGLKIAFTIRVPDSAGIYVVDSTGANLHSIRSGAGIGLTWSPDSKWIAFSSEGTLYKMLADGDSVTQLSAGPTDYRPTWSPDGKRIAYVNGGIRALNLQDTTITNLVPYGEYPAWHPNSQQVLYTVYDAPGNGRYYNEFRTISFVDSQEVVVVSFYSDALAEFASYRNDGNDLIMSLRPPDNSGLSQVVKVSLVSYTLVQLTTDGGDYPVWSPNGAKIVYTQTKKGDGGLWIMNSDGTGKHALTVP